MNFKKIVGFLSIWVLVSCSSPLYNSVYQSVHVVADGKANEWSMPLDYFDSEAKIQYTFSNDRDNLYLCIKSADEQAQKKIINGGLQVWVDTTGKNKKQVGILFPVGNDEKKESREERKNTIPSLKRSFFNTPKEMLLTGFKSPLRGLTSVQANNDIGINLNWDSVNTLTYEAIIPFKTFYKPVLALSDSLKVFGISVTINGLTPPKDSEFSAKEANSGMPGGGAGGGGMPGARGMGGGGMGRTHAGASNPLFDSHTVKTKLQLAVKPKKNKSTLGAW